MKMMIHILETNNNIFYNSCYLIENLKNHAGILVDPTWNADQYEDIIQEKNIKPNTILLTHSHIDHVNLVNYFTQNYDSEVCISREEARYYNYSCNNLHLLNDKDKIELDGINVTCHLTPGHTVGSMSYEIGCNLFVGDTIFYEGCGLCNYTIESMKAMYRSIQNIKSEFPDYYKVYPGHVYYKEVGQSLGDIKCNNLSFLLDESQFIEYQKSKK